MTVLEDWEPRAVGGGPLRGDNVTKFVHMDEAGISHSEPFCSQAGVVVTADGQWKKVERRLSALVNSMVPAKYREDGYVFHAKEIFHGTDSYYSRERFPEPADRARVVQHVAAIAAEFDLPVFVGFVEKAKFPSVLEWKDRRKSAAHFHALAFQMCAGSIDAWMNANAPKGEVAMLFVENNNQSRQVISIVHRAISSTGKAGQSGYQRIVEMPSFVEKRDSSLLQIADACAFSFTRMKRKLSLSDFLVDGFAKQLKPVEYRTR